MKEDVWKNFNVELSPLSGVFFKQYEKFLEHLIVVTVVKAHYILGELSNQNGLALKYFL